MYLLPDDSFQEAMAAYARHGLTTVSNALADDPDVLAAEGRGDDPDACYHEEDLTEEELAAVEAVRARRTGSGWRATWLADVMRAEGLVVVEVEGWRGRGVSFPDSPAEEGVSLFHHTASSAASGPTGGLRIVTYGRPGLPGPICNWLTARNGVIYIVAAGVANHAGRGNARTAGLPRTSGNSNAFGNEMENNGIGERYSPIQYTAAIKSHAAVHRKMGWKASRGIGHKEWSTSGKPDPKLDMAQVRRDLAVAIARGTVPGEDEDDVDQKTGDAILRELTALNDFLMTGRRYGKSATAPPDSEQIGTLHKLLQSVDRRLEVLVQRGGSGQ
jgi:hypothetical protein